MNLNRDEMNTLYDALTQAIEMVEHDISNGLYTDEPEDLMDAKAYIKRMNALQDRIHAKLYSKEQP